MNLNDNIPNRNNDINNQKLMNKNLEKPNKTNSLSNNSSLTNFIQLKNQLGNYKNKKAENLSQNSFTHKNLKNINVYKAKKITNNNTNKNISFIQANPKQEIILNNVSQVFNQSMKNSSPFTNENDNNKLDLNNDIASNNFNYGIYYNNTQSSNNIGKTNVKNKNKFNSKDKILNNNKILNEDQFALNDIKNKNLELNNNNIALTAEEKEDFSKSKEKLLSEKFTNVVEKTCFKNFNNIKVNSMLKKSNLVNKSYGELKTLKAINKENLGYKAINTTDYLVFLNEKVNLNAPVKDFDKINYFNRNFYNSNKNENNPNKNNNNNKKSTEKLNKSIIDNALYKDFLNRTQEANIILNKKEKEINEINNLISFNNNYNNNKNSVNLNNPYLIRNKALKKENYKSKNKINNNNKENVLSKSLKNNDLINNNICKNNNNNDLKNLKQEAINNRLYTRTHTNANSYAYIPNQKKDFFEEKNFNSRNSINFEAKENEKFQENEEIQLFETKTENTEDEVILDLDQYNLLNYDYLIGNKNEKNFFELNSSNDLIDYKKHKHSGNFNNKNTKNYEKENNENENDIDFYKIHNKNNFDYFPNSQKSNYKNLKNQSAYFPNKKLLDYSADNYVNLKLNTYSSELEGFLQNPSENNYFNNKEFLLFTNSVGNLETKGIESLNRKSVKLFFHNKLRKNMRTSIDNELNNTEVKRSKPLLDLKSRSSANIAKNPLMAKHINSRILTLNSDNEDLNSKKSDEHETSSIIDSDKLNDYKYKNSASLLGKVNLKKLDLPKATENDLIYNEEEPRNSKNKLNYHRRRKNANSNKKYTNRIKGFDLEFAIGSSKKNNNNNSGSITAKYVKGIDNAGNHVRVESDNANLLKKFSLWKTIDNEIINGNFDDLKKTIRILEYFIKVLKEDYNNKEIEMKSQIEKLKKENLDIRLENKTLHSEIKQHKSTIYTIYKRSIDFEHSKIIEEKETILTISKLLKENEYLRELMSRCEINAKNDYTEMLDKILNNPDAKINANNFEAKINSMLLKNKNNLKREKSESSIKRLKPENNVNYDNTEINNEFICEIENENENFYVEKNNEEEIKTLKNIGCLADICNINCDFFDKKILSKSSRNLANERKANVPKLDLKSNRSNITFKNSLMNDYNENENENLLSIKNKNVYEKIKIKYILDEYSLEGINKKIKSRNDNNKNKLEKNPKIFDNAEFDFDLNSDNNNSEKDLTYENNNNIYNNNKKESSQLIKIEDQEESDCAMDITIIEFNKEAKNFSFDENNNFSEGKLEKEKNENEKKNYFAKSAEEANNEDDLLEIRTCNNDLVNTINDNDSLAISTISSFINIEKKNICEKEEDEKIYAFKNEFANKLSNFPKSDRKIGFSNASSNISSSDKLEKAQKHSLSKIILNEKKQKLQFPTTSRNTDNNYNKISNNNNNPIIKILQQQMKTENLLTNEKNESTNFTTDINSNSNQNAVNKKNDKLENNKTICANYKINNLNNDNNESGLFNKKIIEEKQEEILEEKSFRENLVPISSRKNSDSNISFKVETGKEEFYLFSSTPRDLSNNNNI